MNNFVEFIENKNLDHIKFVERIKQQYDFHNVDNIKLILQDYKALNNDKFYDKLNNLFGQLRTDKNNSIGQSVDKISCESKELNGLMQHIEPFNNNDKFFYVGSIFGSSNVNLDLPIQEIKFDQNIASSYSYFYSFGLYPETHQPSGSINFSRI
ncbi:Hypothetical protein KVN_LOCUS374 [uncultured virus]|nr:Hypothetical protein KVN_LOCUS374 [uncultured virus]